MDGGSAPFAVFVLAALLLGVAAFGALTLGWPWIKRAWWARKASAIRNHAASRIDRFTASTPADAAARASSPSAKVAQRGTRPRRRGAVVPVMGALATADRADGDAAWAGSSRLRRLAAQVAAQEELVGGVGRELDVEAEPLRRLLDRQASAIARVMANLGQQLEPVRAFAAGEESNLSALQERIQHEGMGYVAHAFSEVVAEQRERIQMTRARIESQRAPFERFASDEQKTIELALGRLDSDIDALESALAEQRKVTLRLLDAMRSDDFKAVMEFLLARQQVLEEVAGSGVTDPSEIAARIRAARGEQPSDAPQRPGMADVLENAAGTDERLMTAGTGASAQEPASAAEQPQHDAEEDEEPAAA